MLDGSAVVEDEDGGPRTGFGHTRAGSMNWPSNGHDRAAGVMRRLSLGGALGGVRVSDIHTSRVSPLFNIHSLCRLADCPAVSASCSVSYSGRSVPQ